MNRDEVRDLDEFLRDFNQKSDCLADKYPVIRWGDQTWIQIDPIRFQPDPQRITVIDITTMEGYTAIFTQSDGREYAVVIFHEDVGVLNKNLRYRRVHLADVMVRVGLGTKEDFQKLRKIQMEELETSIDAGGKILD